MALDDVLDKMPNKSRAFIFDHEKASGINIQWSLQGCGFGELTLVIDKKTGEIRGDIEGMGPESCAKILKGLVGTVVQDISIQEPQLVIDDPAVVAHVKKLIEKRKQVQ